jgi:hypothetical protein
VIIRTESRKIDLIYMRGTCVLHKEKEKWGQFKKKEKKTEWAQISAT